MLHHKSRSACGEIIHVRQILVELLSLTLRNFIHFSLSSQLLLHPCMDLNETWAGMLHLKSKSACGAGIDLGRAFAILALIFRKWRREKTVWGHFGAEKLNLALIVKCTGSNKRTIHFPLQNESKSNAEGLQNAFTRQRFP